MAQQADPIIAASSSPTELWDLPVSCLHHIVTFMDQMTKLQCFRTCKGRLNEVLLRACKLKYRHKHTVEANTSPALCSLIHWAAQISTDMELDIAACGAPLMDVLHSLLYMATHVLGRPATYPGVTSLTLRNYTCTSLMPELLADALPNLKSFTARWRADESQPLGPLLTRGLPSLQHIAISLSHLMSDALRPAANEHIGQQLSHLPSLTSMDATSDHQVLHALPAAVLLKLKKLQMDADVRPTDERKAVLKACTQLESLVLADDFPGSTNARDWLQGLPQHAPNLRALEAALDMDDQSVCILLALPHLASVTLRGAFWLIDDYASAPRGWKQLAFTSCCTSYITRLPLHALDSPVRCDDFKLVFGDYAADLAALRAAKPHLLRCGGVQIESDVLNVHFRMVSATSIEQAVELVKEWAPCLSVPQRISLYFTREPAFVGVLTQLWPKAELNWPND